MEILWQTIKKCYPNEKAALDAVSKNAAVVQPQARAHPQYTFHYTNQVQSFGALEREPIPNTFHHSSRRFIPVT